METVDKHLFTKSVPGGFTWNTFYNEQTVSNFHSTLGTLPKNAIFVQFKIELP